MMKHFIICCHGSTSTGSACIMQCSSWWKGTGFHHRHCRSTSKPLRGRNRYGHRGGCPTCSLVFRDRGRKEEIVNPLASIRCHCKGTLDKQLNADANPCSEAELAICCRIITRIRLALKGFILARASKICRIHGLKQSAA